MKTMFKLSFTLAAYTVAACLALAFIYNKTAPIIAETAANEVKTALREIYPSADEFEDVSSTVPAGDGAISFEKAYVAKQGGQVAGMVIQATGPTYSSATLLVGVDPDRKIRMIRFMSISDTPGLGANATDEKFKGQFTGKPVDDAFKAGSAASGADITAISGATITSKGVSRIVQLTGSTASKYLADKYGRQ